jgi:site-specific DNA-cytosine methylase
MVDCQASQVVLDSLSELRRRIETQHSARQVPSRANLADQRQSLRVWIQRRPDELIRDIGAIELGGIDVIDAEFCGAPQNRNRLAAVSRRPEYARTWQLHGTEADA